jgi:hypothetical protein
MMWKNNITLKGYVATPSFYSMGPEIIRVACLSTYTFPYAFKTHQAL